MPGVIGGGSWVLVDELFREDELRSLVNDVPICDADAAAEGRDPIPDYALSLMLNEDHTDYTARILERSTGFVYQSNKSGVIYQGIAEPLKQAFGGEPLHAPPRMTDSTLMGRARAAARWLWNAILPEVHACCAEWVCPSGFCLPPGPCSPVCNPGRCCDLGYIDCTWCGAAASSCGCYWMFC